MALYGILGEQADNGENFDDNPILAEKMALLSPSLRCYFFLAGQWFTPVKGIIKRKNFPRKPFRIAYSIWQGIVVIFMWSFFAYSMGLFSPLRSLKEVDWRCPLTDIKNMAYGLCWIVNQHTGLVFFLMSNLENLLIHLSITKEDVRSRASSSWLFLVGSVMFLFILPLGLHLAQMIIPDFLPLINYKNNTATNETFPPVQIVFDAVFYTLSRAFALPVFYVFLNMLLFLSCEVEKFNEELLKRDYRREDQAKQRAKEIKNLIMDTERAFRFFLVLYIAMLLLATALEFFSIVEKIETVIIGNHTIHCLPASATNSLQALPFAQENIKAFPHRLAGKRSFPYLLVVIPPGNDSSGVTGANRFFHRMSGWTETVMEQYKLKTQEIVVTALLDITQNVVLYALPLYKMTTLKTCLKSVQATVEDSDYGDLQDSNMKIFNTRQDREDFKTYFRDTCTSGIRVLGKEVSFLWTLVLTFFGPFAVVVVNLMFKHIHVESPLE